MFKLMIYSVAAFFIALTTIYSVNAQSGKRTTGSDKDNGKYSKEWKEIDSLVQLGLPESALDIVQKIYKLSKAEGDHPQFLKAILNKMSLVSSYQENFYPIIIKDLEKELTSSASPVKQIIHSVLADLYWRFYDSNRYRFLQRTATENYDKEDINTWDIKHLADRCIDHYLESLSYPGDLKKVSLKPFDVILETEVNSKIYRPTLYDFLAHRAVDFFFNEEPSLVKPAITFEIDQAVYFANADDFTKISINTPDSMALQFFAMKIMQDIIAFHLQDENPEPLVDADLKRLDLIRRHGVMEHKDSLYFEALNRLEKIHSGNKASAEIQYAIAKELVNTGQKYNEKEGIKYRWNLKKAEAWCNKAIKSQPDSDGATNCKVLLADIHRRNLHFTTERNIIPGKPYPVLIKYRNTGTLFMKAVSLDPDASRQKTENYLSDEELLSYYNSLPVYSEWKMNLDTVSDFQEHSVECSFPSLPNGYYVIIISDKPDFSLKQSAVSYNLIWVSRISYIYKKKSDNSIEMYLLDRETGKALGNVTLNTYSKTFDYNSRSYKVQLNDKYISDNTGYILMPSASALSKTASFFIEMIDGNDRLIADEYFYISPVQTKEEYRIETLFFTDRAIYRPGQTVYFKGIVLGKDGNKNEIKPDHKTTISFYDVNNQKINELSMTTNEFGTFSGSFVIPSGLLNGIMQIRNENGSESVRVEEYKRPAFEVVFGPVSGVYKLNETVTVKGKAQGYAGNDVDHARVTFRVVRDYYFPYNWYRYGWDYFPYYSNETEITNGNTMTSEKGEFEIQFNLIPDKTVQSKNDPVYSFTVYADVTDITGEVQSSSTLVNAGYKGLLILLDIPEKVNVAERRKFSLKTVNLNGIRQEAEVELSIYKLIEPEGIQYERKWDNPEKSLLNPAEFNKIYSNHYLDNKYAWINWKTGEKVFTKVFNTGLDSLLSFDNAAQWGSGYYMIEGITKDQFGEIVKIKEYFMLFSPADKKLPARLPAWFSMITEVAEPGKNVSFILGTAEKNVNVLFEIVHGVETISKSWITLSDEMKLFEVPVNGQTRGEFTINIAFIKNNCNYAFEGTYKVPEVSKEIDFEFITFRNLISPGSKEEWKIRLKNKQGDKLAAEMLVGMYDASLDIFGRNQWSLGLMKPYLAPRLWQSRNSFLTRDSRNYVNIPESMVTPVYREYDRLNWFGFSYFNDRFMLNEGITMAKDDSQRMLPPGQADIKEAEAGEDKEQTVIKDEGLKKPPLQKTGTGLQIRRDFRETAFFYPDLTTNEDGDVIFSFTAPESLTRYRLLGLAHTADLFTGSFEKEVTARKDLMVIPNMPRFVREGDRIWLAAKIVNTSEADISGKVSIEVIDAYSEKPLNVLINMNEKDKTFTCGKGNSMAISWEILAPETTNALIIRISAQSTVYSDGFEIMIPVLSNRMLVTESLPLPVNGKQQKKFRFEKLISTSKSTSIRNHKLTLEYTSNPVWYAVQALPSLLENPNENVDDIFNRYYANSLSMMILDKNPSIKGVFEIWRKYEPSALLSNLEKNQDLKNVMLQETPWVLDSKEETANKNRISMLFDRGQIDSQLENCIHRLKDMQMPSGGWPWFEGMPESRWVTQYIVTGFSKLVAAGIIDLNKDVRVKAILRSAFRYLDNETTEGYLKLKERYPEKLSEDHLGYLDIQYIYTRTISMLKFPVDKKATEAYEYYTGQMKKFWVTRNKYMQGMIAIALFNKGDKETPVKILASLKETALINEETGMYWRDNNSGYYWYEAPVEAQAMLTEAFATITKDLESVELMKKWLLKQKQTQSWSSSRSTADAVYALLMYGEDWLGENEAVTIKTGDIEITHSKDPDLMAETKTGYFKTSWTGPEIKPVMGEINISNPNSSPAWGAMYWQYFEDLDKITSQSTGLKITKKLLVEKNTALGPVLQDFDQKSPLRTGDKIVSRIVIVSDRDMEFVHLKDMRAAAFEPLGIISGYRYQDGLGYYQSVRDVSTDFFFDYLPKGTYVFEYPVRVTQEGEFSNGTAMIQCMYAPEFSSHSEGIRVRCEK